MWCCQSEGTLQSKQHGLLTCIWVSYRYTYIKHTFSVSQDKNMFKSDDSQGTLTNNVLFIWIGAHGTGVIIHICIYIYKYIYMYACMYIYIYIWWPPQEKKTYLFASKLVVHFKDTWTKSTSLSTCFSGERRPTKITKGRSGRPLLHNSRLGGCPRLGW